MPPPLPPGSESQAIVLPEPRGGPINIRPAVLSPGGGADVMFIDQLQKKHNKMVGFMPRMQLQAYIKGGHVLIAEEKVDKSTSRQVEMAEAPALRPDGSDVDFSTCRHFDVSAEPLGYVVFLDKYLKREELGIVYHLNVVPGRQRGLVGASLVKAAFERSAYGCKLFCCWCAQDLEANHFWESVGFVPIAFRAGARPRMKKSGAMSKPGRTHIFWQRRIREGDTETPYWFPSETTGGAMRQARIVLPIPPGTHWSDAKPAVLPGMEHMNTLPAGSEDGSQAKKPHPRGRKPKPAPVSRPKRGLWFAPPAPPPLSPEEKKAAKAKEPKVRFKNDPKYIAAARELRDRYLEEVNANRLLPGAQGKYDVSRQLEAAPSTLKQTPLLRAA